MRKTTIYDLCGEMHATIERGCSFNPDRDKFQKLWFEILPYESDICGYEDLSTENFLIAHTGEEWFFYCSELSIFRDEPEDDEYYAPLIIGWYKHPLRCVWASRDITISEFRKILNLYKEECKKEGLL